MTEPPRNLFWFCYLGLASAIVANVLIIVLQIEWGRVYGIPGNVAAVLICIGAFFLIRWRRRNPR